MDNARLLPTEKMILYDKLARCERLDTDVKQFKRAKPIKNPVPEDQIGCYRRLGSRMCVTAEMSIIKQYIEKKKEMPPSFLEAGPREHLYFDPKKLRRIGIVTPGGIAPGLNTVIHSILNMHCNIYGMTREAYGFLGGLRGIVQERFEKLTPAKTEEWIHKGGTGIGAGRGNGEKISVMVKNLEGLLIDILYVIGGDGSLTVAHEIAKEIEKRGRKIVVAGIPKTMDNDVLWVWHSFGFDTAVEEATRIVNALHDEAKSTGRICLLQLFGRDAGFVAAHAALASGHVRVVLVPEVPFKIDLVLDYVQEAVADKGHALVVVAEGVCPKGGEKYVRKRIRARGLDPDKNKDPRVHEAFQEERLRLFRKAFEDRFKKFRRGRHRVFVVEPRYLIRAIPAHAVDQIYCQRLSDLTVHNTLAGFTDFMISQWLTEYVLVPLRLVAEQIDPKTKARQTKSIPPKGIFWKTVINSTGQPSFN